MKKWLKIFSYQIILVLLFLIVIGCEQTSPLNLKEAKQHPQWMQQPIISTGSNQEPLIFRRRKGVGGTQVKEEHIHSHSLKVIEEEKEFGGTFHMTHLFKAYGLEAESGEIAEAIKFSALLHQNGMKVGTYVGSTIGYETFLLERPDAKDWLVPDYLGHPVVYRETQYHRRRPYFQHPGYKKFIKKVLRIGIEEVKTDMIHFDNPANQARPEVFHHPLAIQQFRAFLREKYSPEERRERIGFSDVSLVEPPRYTHPERMQAFNDPVTQEWIDFRCQQLADYYAEMAAYIKHLNPEVAVEINPHGITGVNRAWESSVDFPRLLAHTDCVVCEDGNPASVTEDGILISNIRSYKMGRSLDTIVLNGIDDNIVMAAEAMAFNQHWLHYPDLLEPLKHYIQFYRDHFAHYQQTENVASVAVLRSFPSMAYNNYNTHQSTILFEQTLIQDHIPFDIIYDQHLKNLSKYQVVVLANQESLGDEQLALLRAFVQQGGGLVVTGNTAKYDQWRRERPIWGMSGVFGSTHPADKQVRLQINKGRVVYIPAVRPAKKRPATTAMRNQYWALPKNWQVLSDAVRWVAAGAIPVEIEAPKTTVLELTAQPAQSKRMLHLINYAAEESEETGAVRNIRVWLQVPEGKAVEMVTLLSPDKKKQTQLTYTQEKDKITFTVPQLKIYDLVVIRNRSI